MSKTALNTYFDQLFYDVSTVSEQHQLNLPPLGEQPLLLCLEPGQDGALVTHQNLAEMKASRRIPSAFAVPGAVSASLGGVAFGQNLADTLDQPVCVILPSAVNCGWCSDWWLARGEAEARSNADVLVEIFQDPDFKVTHLIGHSKGCADLAQALAGLEKKGWPDGFDPTVVTLGGVVQFPRQLSNVHQLLGQYDWLGYLNSRTDLDYLWVPNSGHHLNRQLPFHLDVPEVLSTYSPPAHSPL